MRPMPGLDRDSCARRRRITVKPWSASHWLSEMRGPLRSLAARADRRTGHDHRKALARCVPWPQDNGLLSRSPTGQRLAFIHRGVIATTELLAITVGLSFRPATAKVRVHSVESSAVAPCRASSRYTPDAHSPIEFVVDTFPVDEEQDVWWLLVDGEQDTVVVRFQDFGNLPVRQEFEWNTSNSDRPTIPES